jgi:predicted acetyltransferase
MRGVLPSATAALCPGEGGPTLFGMNPFPPPPDLVIRPAARDDASKLGQLWARAFPGERSAAERTEGLLEGIDLRGGIETAFIGEVEGRVAGAFRAYRLETHLFGRPIPALGLAAVAVSASFRRKGIGAALCREAIRIGRERGDLLSILYPFRVDFYRRLGWALAGSFHRFRFAPESLPLFPERAGVRLLEPGERAPAIPELYDALLPRRHGLLSRSPTFWKDLDDPDRLVVGVGDGPLEGAAILRSRQGSRREEAEVRLEEVHLSGPESYRAILGWVSAQRDQWRRVTWDALPGERLHDVLADPRRPHSPDRRGLWFEGERVLRGPMVRILHLEGLGRTLGTVPGARIELHDPVLESESGAWVGTEDGGLVRESAEVGPGALPVSVASELLVRGAYPGIGTVREDFRPVMGIDDFHLLESF